MTTSADDRLQDALDAQAAADRAWAAYRDAVALRCTGAHMAAPPRDPDAPVVDRDTFQIAYGRGRCNLHGIVFALFERLARRPGVYVPMGTLQEYVWPGRVVSPSAVRQAILRLRRRLRDGGLADLADGIDGREPGHYVLRPIWRNVTKKSPRCRIHRHRRRRS